MCVSYTVDMTVRLSSICKSDVCQVESGEVNCDRKVLKTMMLWPWRALCYIINPHISEAGMPHLLRV